MDINKVILIGNVTQDPQIKPVNDKFVATFSIATNKSFKDKNGVKQNVPTFHNIECWGKLVDIVENYVRKGLKVYVEGEIKIDNYEKDGIKKSITKIVIFNLVLLSSKNNESKDVEDLDINDIPV
jgi:single-strand DNA-binding protein